MTLVSVPEASLHKNYGTKLGQYNVRPAREITNVKPETESLSMQPFSYCNFGDCVFSVNTGHHAASRRLVDYIYHQSSSTQPAARRACLTQGP